MTDSVPALGLTDVMNGLDASAAVPPGTASNPEGISSQVSSISVAAGDRASFGTAPARRRSGVLLAGAVGVVTLLTVGIAIGVSATRTNKTSTAGAGAEPPRSVTGTATTAPAVSAQPPPTFMASASAAPTQTAAPTTTPPVTANHPTTRLPVVKPVETANSKPDDCKIPYTISANGERIYKRHCF